jgi:hypothetical protein
LQGGINFRGVLAGEEDAVMDPIFKRIPDKQGRGS